MFVCETEVLGIIRIKREMDGNSEKNISTMNVPNTRLSYCSQFLCFELTTCRTPVQYRCLLNIYDNFINTNLEMSINLNKSSSTR